MENNENNVQNQEKKQKKGLSTPLVVVMLIAVLIIGIGGGYLLSKNDNLFNKNGTQLNNNNNNESQNQNTSNTDNSNKDDNEVVKVVSIVNNSKQMIIEGKNKNNNTVWTYTTPVENYPMQIVNEGQKLIETRKGKVYICDWGKLYILDEQTGKVLAKNTEMNIGAAAVHIFDENDNLYTVSYLAFLNKFDKNAKLIKSTEEVWNNGFVWPQSMTIDGNNLIIDYGIEGVVTVNKNTFEIIDRQNKQNESIIPIGLYQYKQKIEEDFAIRYTLYLYNNGTFKYEHSIAAPTGAIGKYTIKDDNLILNVQYLTGSDTGITKTNEIITLKINNNTIIDQNGYYKDLSKKYSNIDFNNITMVKANENDDKEYLKAYPSIENIINNAVITDIDGTEIQKNTEYAKYYIEKIKQLDFVNDSTKYGLLYIYQRDIPYLIVDTGGDLSVYKINNNTVVTLKERDSYGTHGRDGYDYIEGTNIMRAYCTSIEGYCYEIYDELFNYQYYLECTFDGQYKYEEIYGEEKIITEEEFNKLAYKNSNFKHLRTVADKNKEDMIKFLENK